MRCGLKASFFFSFFPFPMGSKRPVFYQIVGPNGESWTSPLFIRTDDSILLGDLQDLIHEKHKNLVPDVGLAHAYQYQGAIPESIEGIELFTDIPLKGLGHSREDPLIIRVLPNPQQQPTAITQTIIGNLHTSLTLSSGKIGWTNSIS